MRTYTITCLLADPVDGDKVTLTLAGVGYDFTVSYVLTIPAITNPVGEGDAREPDLPTVGGSDGHRRDSCGDGDGHEFQRNAGYE